MSIAAAWVVFGLAVANAVSWIICVCLIFVLISFDWWFWRRRHRRRA